MSYFLIVSKMFVIQEIDADDDNGEDDNKDDNNNDDVFFFLFGRLIYK